MKILSLVVASVFTFAFYLNPATANDCGQLVEGQSDSQPWWDRDANGVRAEKMSTPYENVYIGTDPRDGLKKETAESFDVFINVADSPSVIFEPYPHKRHYTYWFPINEMGYWSHSSFYGAIKALDFHIRAGHKIYLHCHAGAHRSPLVFLVYLLYEGKTILEASEILMPYSPLTMGKKFVSSVKKGHIPNTIFLFLQKMRENPHSSIQDLMNPLYPEMYDDFDQGELDADIFVAKKDPSKTYIEVIESLKATLPKASLDIISGQLEELASAIENSGKK